MNTKKQDITRVTFDDKESTINTGLSLSQHAKLLRSKTINEGFMLLDTHLNRSGQLHEYKNTATPFKKLQNTDFKYFFNNKKINVVELTINEDLTILSEHNGFNAVESVNNVDIHSLIVSAICLNFGKEIMKSYAKIQLPLNIDSPLINILYGCDITITKNNYGGATLKIFNLDMGHAQFNKQRMMDKQRELDSALQNGKNKPEIVANKVKITPMQEVQDKDFKAVNGSGLDQRVNDALSQHIPSEPKTLCY